jgi:hypothetical protein
MFHLALQKKKPQSYLYVVLVRFYLLNQLMKRDSNFHHNISTNKENTFCLKCVYIHLPTSEMNLGWFSQYNDGLRAEQGARLSLKRPDGLWGPPCILSSGYLWFFPQDQGDQGVQLNSHLHLVLRSRIVELYLHSTITIHDTVLNLLNTRESLPN